MKVADLVDNDILEVEEAARRTTLKTVDQFNHHEVLKNEVPGKYRVRQINIPYTQHNRSKDNALLNELSMKEEIKLTINYYQANRDRYTNIYVIKWITLDKVQQKYQSRLSEEYRTMLH